MIPKLEFTANMIKLNYPKMNGFKRWKFQQGMTFNSMDQWWGKPKKRPAPHEGIDLCAFETVDGKVRYLSEGDAVPVTLKGTIMKIMDDFLGKSIFIRHSLAKGNNLQLYTLYGHTRPKSNINTGYKVTQGESLGYIAGINNSKAALRPHLHISLAWIDGASSSNDLIWSFIGSSPMVKLLDPLPLI